MGATAKLALSKQRIAAGFASDERDRVDAAEAAREVRLRMASDLATTLSVRLEHGRDPADFRASDRET